MQQKVYTVAHLNTTTNVTVYLSIYQYNLSLIINTNHFLVYHNTDKGRRHCRNMSDIKKTESCRLCEEINLL